MSAPDAPIVELDLQGLKCPLPALRTRGALTRVRSGSVIAVSCTDPLAAIDIPALVQEMGDKLLSQESENGVLRFCIRKV